MFLTSESYFSSMGSVEIQQITRTTQKFCLALAKQTKIKTKTWEKIVFTIEFIYNI